MEHSPPRVDVRLQATAISCNLLGIIPARHRLLAQGFPVVLLVLPSLAMNKVLIESIKASDGRYLSDIELRPFAQFVASYETRFTTYALLKEKSETLVLNSLRRLMQTPHRTMITEQGSKCQRDMIYTLQCVAQAILLDDTQGFIETYVLWMQNITRALHKESSAIDAYRALQQEVSTTFSPEGALLINQPIDQLIQAFSEGL